MGTSGQAVLKRETLVQMLTPVQKCGYWYPSDYTGSPWEINEHETYLVSFVFKFVALSFLCLYLILNFD